MIWLQGGPFCNSIAQSERRGCDNRRLVSATLPPSRSGPNRTKGFMPGYHPSETRNLPAIMQELLLQSWSQTNDLSTRYTSSQIQQQLRHTCCEPLFHVSADPTLLAPDIQCPLLVLLPLAVSPSQSLGHFLFVATLPRLLAVILGVGLLKSVRSVQDRWCLQ